MENIKLTEENITDYGFEFQGGTRDWVGYSRKGEKISLNYCKNGAKEHKGHFWYGADWIQIDTIEELKSLYKLVTKKELI